MELALSSMRLDMFSECWYGPMLNRTKNIINKHKHSINVNGDEDSLDSFRVMRIVIMYSINI